MTLAKLHGGSATALTSERPESAGTGSDQKRRQVLDGARRVFLNAGFDGASMGDCEYAGSADAIRNRTAQARRAVRMVLSKRFMRAPRQGVGQFTVRSFASTLRNQLRSGCYP